MRRTHTCGCLKKSDVKKSVVLQGWVNKTRLHGGVIFLDIRDFYGITQVVFNQKDDKGLFEKAKSLNNEDCIEIHGKVCLRKDINPNIPTGEIEVFANKLEILSKSAVLPLDISEEGKATEETRMKYRYLDLRRPSMQKNFVVRHKATQAAREYLSEQGFLEIETPFFVKPTPEGARDYIVPSRVNPGKFYSLPQSPQLYKQILMVSGFDRYFQLPRCLRDEDCRIDRQPEFTQIDAEMCFPDIDDLFTFAEGTMENVFKKAIGYDIRTPFPRIQYKEAMDKYGNDKPDIRFELFLHDITDIAGESNFEIFKTIIKNGGIVKCVNPEKDFTRKEIEKYEKFCKQLGAKGLVCLKVNDKEKKLEGSTAKFFNEKLQKKLIDKLKAKPNSTIMIIADSFRITNDVLSRLRNQLGSDLKLYNPKEFKFCWVIDFPLFEWNEEEEKWDPSHHLFCMPKEEDMKYLETDPGRVHCYQYDLALNGVEVLSGSIRINRQDVQERVMKVIGLTHKEVENKFGFLLGAFKYGAPPHGGWAFGFDRINAMMCGTHDIRDVIAFPKNKAAQSPMDGSPSDVDKKQLKELFIKIDKEQIKKLKK